MKLLVLLLALVGCKSRREVTQERVARQMPVVEVAPAPLPSALPLVGDDGNDSDGYPRKYVDRAALRSLLWHKQYAELTRYFEQLESAFEADPTREYWPMDAGDAFASAEPALLASLDAWVAATPKSFAPYLARGTYFADVAATRRGSKTAKETPDDDMKAMTSMLPRALADLEHALALSPKLVAAMRQELKVLRYESSGFARARALTDHAIEVCPTCFQVRVTELFSLRPRWGGSYAEMAELAATKSSLPKFRLLPGYIDLDKAEVLALQNRYPEALAAIDRACALGEHWEFLVGRADLRHHLGEDAAALVDVDRALQLRPGLPGILILRAGIEAMLRRWEPAGRDLLAGLRSDPTNHDGRYWQEPIKQGLAHDGWTAHQAGRHDDAVRILDLAEALAPNDKDVSRWRSWAILGNAQGPSEIEKLEAVVAKNPDDFRAVQQLDYAWSKEGGKYDRIVEMWTRYLERHPVDGAAYLERGGAFFHLRKRAEALADAKKACELGQNKGCEVQKHLQ